MKQYAEVRFFLLVTALLCLVCSQESAQGVWKSVTFMDCDNITHNITIRLTDALYDSESGYLKVVGAVKNNMPQERLFNVRNWVYRLDEQGRYLKAQSVGLPSILLPAAEKNGPSRDEEFTIIFKIGPNASTSNIVLDYADQFFMTGKVNRIILSVPLHVTRAKVSSRG